MKTVLLPKMTPATRLTKRAFLRLSLLPVAAPWLGAEAFAAGSAPSATEVIAHVLESDVWGLNGASITAHATLTDKTGAKSELAFTSKSKKLEHGLSKALVRFSAPADLAGAGFLQIEESDADDQRYLFLPELKRSRRISGSLRSSAFMGTDLSFGDLDRRDLREGEATITGSEAIDKRDCYVLKVTPKRSDSQYSRIELWAKQDNFVPLRMKMYDRSGTHIKTLTALEIRRVSGRWFISKSRMVNHTQSHNTELVLDEISTSTQFADDEFTVRALEKSQ
jgi:hypothetical protein